ncbi:MAG: sugar-binding domain-containing protein [Ornithinimicrobium sp.]
MGPSEAVLAAIAARRHYLHGDSKIEIGERLGVNRFKVARLLEAARECGMVRIEIVSPGTVDLDLSAAVKEQYGFEHCAVLAGRSSSPVEDRVALGQVAADLMSEILTAGDVLGLPWSRSTLAMTEFFTQLPSIEVVQLSGAVEMPGFNATAVDMVRTTARASGGSSRIFHAPFILDDIETARNLRRQASVARTLAAAAEVTHAVVGVGAWTAHHSLIYDLCTEAERRSISSTGVVGEAAGVFFDDRGTPIHNDLADRMITISFEHLHAVPHVVALAAGQPRAGAVAAAVRGGLITSLVTDAELAHALIGRDD